MTDQRDEPPPDTSGRWLLTITADAEVVHPDGDTDSEADR